MGLWRALTIAGIAVTMAAGCSPGGGAAPTSAERAVASQPTPVVERATRPALLRDGWRAVREPVVTGLTGLRALPSVVPVPSCRPLPASARLVDVRILSAPDGERPDADPERSTVDAPVTLVAEVTVEVDGQRQTLRGDDDELACVPLTWSRIEPTVRWHTNKDDAGDTRFTPIPYATSTFGHGWQIAADVHPTVFADPFPELETGLGVMHFQLTASLGDQVVSTPGEEARSSYGSLDADRVHRVSYRPDTGSWVDYTFELFNSPYVWGSVGPQVDDQMASDCADLAVYAWRRAGHRDVAYTWSYGMRHETTLRSEVVGIDDDGLFVDEAGAHLVFGEDARAGDVVLLRRHIAVIYDDHDGDGLLGVDDRIVQTNWHQPEVVSFRHMRYEHDAFEVRAWPR